MKVYIVVDYGVPYQDDTENKGVFSTEEKAKKYILNEKVKLIQFYMKQYGDLKYYDELPFDIEEFELE